LGNLRSSTLTFDLLHLAGSWQCHRIALSKVFANEESN